MSFSLVREQDTRRRRGVVLVMVAVMMVALLGMASLTIDVGMMYRARNDLQVAADSAALAAAWELFDDDVLTGSPSMYDNIVVAQAKAVEYANMHTVLSESIGITTTDVTIGYLSNPLDLSEALSFDDPDEFNTVHVIARRDAERDGPIGLNFSVIFGHGSKDVSASAMASFRSGVTGFEAPPGGTVDLAPFALHINAWNGMLDGSWSTGDNFDYDSSADAVLSGGDGIFEINMFPGSGGAQLPPGNFGTVDIGAPGNSTADLARQVVEGVNEDDLSYFGGSLELGEDGTVMLSGDTGISAGIKDELASIIGQTRTIPLFDQVSGTGNTTMFRIVGFGGIRILDVKLTGAANQKRVIVQPALVSVTGAVFGSSSPAGDFVYGPVVLTR